MKRRTRNFQYTVRAVPANVDRALRARAKSTGKSLNEVALEALTQGAGEARVFDDLDFLVGSMSDDEARVLEAEVRAQRQIDPEIWR